MEEFYGKWVSIDANLERGSKEGARKTNKRTRALNENEIRLDLNFSAVGSSKLVQLSVWMHKSKESHALQMVNSLPEKGRRIVLQEVLTNDDSLRIIQKNHPGKVFSLNGILYAVSREIS